MSLRFLHLTLACFALISLGTAARAGMTADTPYTIRGQTDFDTALQLINPYGAWSKVDGKWAFTPTDHQAPYTNGRWIYTEYGWYWKGRLPHSWLTEHYGYWKRRADKIWSWYPGPVWLPEIVELRATSGYIGWRSGEVDADGNFVEPPIDRYTKPEEWTFVTLAQFANPITPAIAAPAEVAKNQLDESTDSHHAYFTYREIDRPGPHPADVASLCQDGGMLPKTLEDAQAAQHPAPSTNALNAAVANGTNAPALLGTDPTASVDMRKVKYWITMSLPTFWTKPPADAKTDQIYSYRPDFFQDEDGIARRITLWFNPSDRGSIQDLLGSNSSAPKPAPGPGGPATPAVPATEDQSPDPFRAPLVDPIHSSSNSPPASASTGNSTKAPVPTGLAPTK